MLLLTTAGVYLFEIKNYTGQFEFRKNQCLINGKKVGHNAIAQAQKVSVNIKSILNDTSLSVNVQGAAIFIGSHNEVIIHDPVEEIEITFGRLSKKRETIEESPLMPKRFLKS